MKDDTASPAPPPSGKPLIWVLALSIVLVAGGLVLFLLQTRTEEHAPRHERLAQEPSPPPSPVQPPEVPGVVSAVPPAAPVTPPPSAPAPAGTTLDLLEGPIPEELEVGREVVRRHGMIHAARLKGIYDYGKAHPGDARPQIIMARDSMARGWVGFAIEHYTHAVKDDPRAASDPYVFDDLITAAASPRYEQKSIDAFRTIYGPGVAPRLEQAAAEAAASGDTARAELLARIRQGVTAPDVSGAAVPK